MYNMGFIGVGSMGSAMARAAAESIGGGEIIVSNRTTEKAKSLASEISCHYGDNFAVASESKFIVLGVKPQTLADVLIDIAPALTARQDDYILVTMAAGVEMAKLRDILSVNVPVIRIMPNTPCAVGKGVVLCCRTENVSDEDYEAFKNAIACAGLVLDMAEKNIDAGCAVSGCGPAFVYTFIESMADAGVYCGLTRAQAQQLAMYTVLGSAQLALDGGAHTTELRDKVCSPGGSTIAGVKSLENDGFRGAVMNAVIAAFERTKELGK